MFELWRKLRQFRFNELSTQEIIIALVAVLIGLWLVSFILDIIRTLVPIVIVALLVYLAYQWLSSRGRDTEDAIASVRAERRAKERTQQGQPTIRAKQDDQARTRIADEPLRAEAPTSLTVKLADSAPMISHTNPDTGLEEIDLARLEEREQALLREAKQINADIQTQIEERRKRLLGNGDAQG
ncbi:MAG: hypothetical protein RML73_04095 [Anaerolineae bacterium]|nr:hypothetical protein [Anaerolineae bacterium]